MPGFVDVTNMSSLEVKRLGQMDDDVEETSFQKKAKAASVLYTADQVWGAAVVASRVNSGNYYKVPNVQIENDQYVTKNRTNKEEMYAALEAGVSEADQEEGRAVREWHKKNLTIKSLKGTLSDFDRSLLGVVELEQFDTRADRYAMSLVPSQIRSYMNGRKEEDARERSTGGYVGSIGDKVILNVEIIRSNYSQNWNVWFANAIAEDGKMVFFSYREQLASGAKLKIQGSVKAHRDDSTQLNRVKVL